jgi:hypothetical protein
VRAVAHLPPRNLAGLFPLLIRHQFLNNREPITLVRSPTISGRLLVLASTSSMPLK